MKRFSMSVNLFHRGNVTMSSCSYSVACLVLQENNHSVSLSNREYQKRKNPLQCLVWSVQVFCICSSLTSIKPQYGLIRVHMTVQLSVCTAQRSEGADHRVSRFPEKRINQHLSSAPKERAGTRGPGGPGSRGHEAQLKRNAWQAEMKQFIILR